MSFTVKLALFPPWKAPVLYETLAGVFATTAEAAEAGEKALASITESELAGLSPHIQPRSQRVGDQCVTAIAVPERAVHGYLIYDETGCEVFNWTMLDIALERVAES